MSGSSPWLFTHPHLQIIIRSDEPMLLKRTSQILQMIESGRVQQQRRTMRAIMVSKEGRVTAKNLFVISDVPPSSREEPP